MSDELAQRGSIIDPFIATEDFERAINKHHGSIKHIAMELGCNRSYVWRYIAGHPELREILKQAREATLDEVEYKLIEKALLGDLEAIKYYLRYHGQRRGYGDEPAQEVNVTHRVLHAIVSPDQAQSIFDVLAGAGALQAIADGAEIDGVYSARSDADPGSVSDPPAP